ncbi:MAG: GvpL/GvpF family gas vesicle protein, partial [Chloroflexota bacterium]
VDRKRAAIAAGILGRLRPLALAVVENKVLVDRMIVNAAFLVGTSRETAFDDAVNKFDAEMQGRVLFRYFGPVPPYNFVNITVNWQEA